MNKKLIIKDKKLEKALRMFLIDDSNSISIEQALVNAKIRWKKIDY